jgi:hypothetical protein
MCRDTRRRRAFLRGTRVNVTMLGDMLTLAKLACMEMRGSGPKRLRGVVTLSQIERNSPITVNAEAWDFNHLACCSIAEIGLVSLNVTTPSLVRN